jgi:hypothetical protein
MFKTMVEERDIDGAILVVSADFGAPGTTRRCGAFAKALSLRCRLRLSAWE